MQKTKNSNDFNAFFHELARVSSNIILPLFRSALHSEDKSQGQVFDPVTIADRDSEAAMRELISARYPDHGIMGEEFGYSNEDAEFVWVLDPIDGTKSFISGSPLWGTLVGLMHHGKPIAGMLNQPFTREMFIADVSGAHWHGLNAQGSVETRLLKTRACATLESATLLTTSPYLIAGELRDKYLQVQQQVRLPRFGGDCYIYAQLAMGHADLVIEAGLKPHDIVALIPIIERAGGIITTWSGGDAAKGGAIVAAGDARVHAQALAILNA